MAAEVGFLELRAAADSRDFSPNNNAVLLRHHQPISLYSISFWKRRFQESKQPLIPSSALTRPSFSAPPCFLLSIHPLLRKLIWQFLIPCRIELFRDNGRFRILQTRFRHIQCFQFHICKHGDKPRTEAWLKAKVESKFPADAQTYGFLVSCCIKTRAFEHAQRYFEEMMVEGLLPDESVVHDMLLMLCQQRDSCKVKEILKLVLVCGWRIDRFITKNVVGLYGELGKNYSKL